MSTTSRQPAVSFPSQFDKFQLLRELGRGSTGAVYLAHQELLNRDLAIKILLPGFSNDEDFVERFQREGRIAASLKHPNIVHLIDASVFEGQYYIAMEYIAGPNLREILQKKELLDWHTSVDICCQVLNALDHAHGKGVIHRDVKPANILLEDNSNRAVLSDFSVAHMKAASRLTTTGTVLGTPEYMAPEVFNGAPVDTRSDIYAMGIILYELLTGVNPFRSKCVSEVLNHQLFTIPKSPHLIKSHIPAELSKIVESMLRKDPLERGSSAAEISRKLTMAIQQTKEAPRKPAIHKIRLRDDESSPKAAESSTTEGGAYSEAPKAKLRIPELAEPAPVPQTSPPSSPPTPLEPRTSAKPTGSSLPPPSAAGGHTKSRRCFWLLLFLLLGCGAGLLFVSQPGPSQGPSTCQVVLHAIPSQVTLGIDDAPLRDFRNGDELQLAPGKHDIKASAQGFRAQQCSITVSLDRVLRLQIQLAPQQGAVKFQNLQPDLEVSVDGKEPRSLAEADTMELPPGIHEFKFSRPHHTSKSDKITVTDGTTVEHAVADLEPLPAQLLLHSEPEGARVSLNSADRGVTPLNISVPPGQILIHLTLEGYSDSEESVDLNPEQVFPRTIVLEKLQPKASPTASPSP